jgi:hypothetical protein
VTGLTRGIELTAGHTAFVAASMVRIGDVSGTATCVASYDGSFVELQTDCSVAP